MVTALFSCYVVGWTACAPSLEDVQVLPCHSALSASGLWRYGGHVKGFTEEDRGHLSGSVSPSLEFYRWAGKSHTDCYLLSVSYRPSKVSSSVTMFQTRSDLSIFEAYVTTQCYLPPPPPPGVLQSVRGAPNRRNAS